MGQDEWGRSAGDYYALTALDDETLMMLQWLWR
jgi:hypothetical protein